MEAVPAVAHRRHLHAVDLMRVLTVALVVGVHTITHYAVSTAVVTNALVVVFHTSREIFFVLTALVLVHSSGRGPVRWRTFWRRRYLCVAVPYVVWTLVYYIADGHSLDPVTTAARNLAGDLITGGARYQLYFLLVSMQIYLCFPLLRWLLRVTERRHGLLLAGCAAFQLVFSEAVHEGWNLGPLLTAWVHGPDAVLPSYLLYVVAGGVAGWHLDAVTSWTLRHRRPILAGTAASIAAAVGFYLVQTGAGQTPKLASGVFQPVVVVESLAIAWTFLCAGLVWVERGMPGRRAVSAASDASFGVYLSHPLLLQGLVAVSTATGLYAASGKAPIGLVLAALVLVAVPAIYVTAAVIATLVRGTPLSLVMTGRRRRRRPSPTPAPALAGAGLARLSQEVSR